MLSDGDLLDGARGHRGQGGAAAVVVGPLTGQLGIGSADGSADGTIGGAIGGTIGGTIGGSGQGNSGLGQGSGGLGQAHSPERNATRSHF
nr:hypothetical protein [Streptomyces tsukubensis NRRL18488]